MATSTPLYPSLSLLLQLAPAGTNRLSWHYCADPDLDCQAVPEQARPQVPEWKGPRCTVFLFSKLKTHDLVHTPDFDTVKVN